METHAQHLHKTPGKNFWHYFYEFLMLFLAVFCGFLAENQREHLVEEHRAKDYAKSLMGDLILDSIEVRGATKYETYFRAAYDSIEFIYKMNKDADNFPASFYFFNLFTSKSYNIDWSSSTMNQLIQSGNLRYLKNKELVDKINNYYALQSTIDHMNEVDMAQREKIRDLRNTIFEHKYFDYFLRMDADSFVLIGQVSSSFVDSLKVQKLPLAQNSKNYLSDYLNHLADRKKRFESDITRWFPNAMHKAEEIMLLLKKEYHLK